MSRSIHCSAVISEAIQKRKYLEEKSAIESEKYRKAQNSNAAYAAGWRARGIMPDCRKSTHLLSFGEEIVKMKAAARRRERRRNIQSVGEERKSAIRLRRGGSKGRREAICSWHLKSQPKAHSAESLEENRRKASAKAKASIEK
jgi:hypothetical protein